VPGAFAWYEPTAVPLESYRSTLYGLPLDQFTLGIVRVPVAPDCKVVPFPLKPGLSALFTFTCPIVTAFVPVFFNVRTIVLVPLPEVPPKVMVVIVIEDVFVNPIVSAPIHAATAMLTATVTAMSMIEATTGLRAFLLFNIFIFLSIPPSRLLSM
jgi:hypothetical protein